MRKLIVIYKPFDIVVVPFPFTDSGKSKRRPAVILSSSKNFGQKIGHSVMAMITSARNIPWPHDVEITNLKSSGLPKPSIIRMKLFTLDNRLIIDAIGALSLADRRSLIRSHKLVFNELFM